MYPIPRARMSGLKDSIDKPMPSAKWAIQNIAIFPYPIPFFWLMNRHLVNPPEKNG